MRAGGWRNRRAGGGSPNSRFLRALNEVLARLAVVIANPH
jgi:hypothetical protein